MKTNILIYNSAEETELYGKRAALLIMIEGSVLQETALSGVD